MCCGDWGMKYDNYAPDEECKQTTRQIMVCKQARKQLEKISGLKGKDLYEALIHAFAKGWLVVE